MNNQEINPYTNPPLSNTAEFIGRETELKNLLQHISPKYRQHITIVDGIGGIGKTALVLQAAYLCQNIDKKPPYLFDIKIPEFKTIIFISLKNTSLSIYNQLKQVYKDSAIQYIFKAIAFKLKNNKNNTEQIYKTSGKEQIDAVYQSLNQQKTLLIIDNLETAKGSEKEEILLFLSNLPSKVQAVITTREKVVFYSPISLDILKEDEGLQLIRQQAENKHIVLTKQDEEALEIYNLADGIPLAMIYSLGQKKIAQANNLLLNTFSTDKNTDKAYFLFKKSLELLSSEFERQLLNSFLFYSDYSSIESLATVVNSQLDSNQFQTGIKKLQDLSLIELIGQEEIRYSMHPVTSECLAKELSQDYDFEKDARARWVQWYVDFSKKYGGRDWENWRAKYNQLIKEWNNLLGVLEWCAANDYYDRVKDLWKNLNQFANLEGYWHDRLLWLSWLIEESQKREDWNTASYAMSEKSFTLIQMEDLPQAELLLNEAWDLEKVFDLSMKGNLENQTLISQHFALLYIKQEKYEQAVDWLENEKKCIELIKSHNIKPKEIIRREIAIDTLEAEICLEKENYEEAESIYKQVVKKSAQIGWHRRKEQAQERINLIQSRLLPNNPISKSMNKYKSLNNLNNNLRSTNKPSHYINLYG